MSRSYDQLEKVIGYVFKDKSFLKQALIHKSYTNESGSKRPNIDCNERLEFLGDSVLSLVVSSYLYEKYPLLPEGDLSRIRSCTVSEDPLAGFASSIELGEYLKLGKGEEKSNGRNKPSITSSAFEALIAAIYLDGGLDSARNFILRFAIPHIEQIEHIIDSKTALQQVVQQDNDAILEYVLIAEEGPAHARSFTIEARLNGNVIGKGKGRSKRDAEQSAAKEALRLFGIK